MLSRFFFWSTQVQDCFLLYFSFWLGETKKQSNLISILGHYWLTVIQHFLDMLSVILRPVTKLPYFLLADNAFVSKSPSPIGGLCAGAAWRGSGQLRH
jgi:hypothetical protein